MEKDEIVPCPFWGYGTQIVHGGTFMVQCADCGAIRPPVPKMQRAAVRWRAATAHPVGNCGWLRPLFRSK
jgi:hypothetical protein